MCWLKTALLILGCKPHPSAMRSAQDRDFNTRSLLNPLAIVPSASKPHKKCWVTNFGVCGKGKYLKTGLERFVDFWVCASDPD